MALDVYRVWLGIPDGPRPPDHYQLLRLVQFEDTVDKVRSNYKKLNSHVRKYATGQYSIQSQELLNELAKAMLCLTDLERKRDYDVSLGREMATTADDGRRTMESLLIERKLISHAQLKEALDFAEQSGLELRDSLVQLKLVDAATAAQALADELGIPYVDLADMLPEDDVLDRVPRSVVKQNSILPLFIDQDVVLIACVHQIDHDLEEELRLRFDLPIRNVLASPTAINQAITKYYAPGVRDETKMAEGAKSSSKPSAKSSSKSAKSSASAASTSNLTPEERKQRRLKGIVIFNFSFPVAYGLHFLLSKPNAGLDTLAIVLYTVIPGITALVCWQMYWKK